jgi:hypothetical protein
MNKRDLIKALFKNPTIKALYESGHFDASDINRAILMEANDENGKENEHYLEELKKQVKELKKQFDEVAAKAAKVKGEKSAAAAKPLVTKRNEIENQIKELEAKIAKLVTKDFAITKAADNTEPNEDDKVAGSVSVFIADTLEKLQFSIEKSSSDLNQQNLDHELDQISNSTKAAIDDIIPAIEKEQDAVKTAQAGGEVGAEKTAKLAPAVKGWKNAVNSARETIARKKLTREDIDEATTSPEQFKKIFGLRSTTDASTALAQFKSIDTEWLNQQLEKVIEIKDQKKKEGSKFEIVPYLENIAATVMSYTEFLKEMDVAKERGVNIDLEKLGKIKFPDTIPTNQQEFEKMFIAPLEQAMGGESQSTASTSTELANDPQAFTSAFERYSKEDDVLSRITDPSIKEIGGAYITLRLKPELFKTPEVEMAPMVEPKYPVTEGDGEESRNRISGNFPGIETLVSSTKSKMSKDAKWRLKKALISGDDELEKVLGKIKDLIDAGKISIRTAPEPTQQPAAELETREQKLLVVQPQQEEALQQKADPKADEDLSVLEQVEMDSAWKEQLDTFFGKNPGSSSFMRKLLLRDQAKMLYSMIATLDKIIQGPRNKGDELEASSLSDQYGEDQPKDSLEEQVINEIFSSLFGNKEKNESVELSKESRGHMRQDLEAMVGLLRSLKEDIRGYSRFATSSSVDPRFDGSTLKKAMDAKLAVVQERIAMLTVQIETSISQQDRQVAADATQELEEVMDLLSEADESERRMKIKKVREVYDEMRRLYIDGLMTSLQNNEPQKSKESAKRIKDYVMEQKDFLSFFPSNIVSGGTVMTLGNAYESMKAIIGKFIDTIRDVVTITKTQNVSKESLGLASRDLIGIAEAIESMFKVSSKIGSDFVKKYKEAAASNPDNQSITNEKPQEDEVDSADQDVDILGFIKDWFSSKASQIAGKVSEKLLKALANGFKGKGLNTKSDEGKEKVEQMLLLVQKNLSWFETLDEESKSALSKMVDHLIKNLSPDALKQINLPASPLQEAISEEERGNIIDFTSKAERSFGKDLSGTMIKFLNGADEETKSLLFKIMSEKADNLIEYLSSIFKIKEDLGNDVAEEVASASADTKEISAKLKGKDLRNWKLSDYPNLKADELIHYFNALSDDEIGIKTDGSSIPVVENTSVKSIAENFGVKFTEDVGSNQHGAIVAIAKIVRILTKDKGSEESTMEESMTKVMTFKLKNTIKKKFKNLSKVDPGHYLTSNLNTLLQEVDLSKDSRKGLIGLVDSIIRHNGDMKKVAEESKEYYATKGSFSQKRKIRRTRGRAKNSEHESDF